MAKKDQAQKDSKKARKKHAEPEDEVPVETIAAHLDDLARALRQSHVVVQAGKESVDVGVGRQIELSLKAKPAGKKGKSSLKLTLTWEIAAALEEKSEAAPVEPAVAATPAPVEAPPAPEPPKWAPLT